jgi:DNA topoisomerase-1
VNLAEKFLTEAHAWIRKTLGKEFAAVEPRRFKGKQKNAQEAHEAIRPTEAASAPETLTILTEDQMRLYDLIWRRAIASQMQEAVLEQTAATVSVPSKSKKTTYDFRANGMTIAFAGYYKIYPTDAKETLLPELTAKEPITLDSPNGVQHFTEPAARYSDATLVKALEEFGIGRPSTYAPTIATIIERNYVERIDNRRLKPTAIALVVNDLLVEHFPQVVDYHFTAHMEDELDHIAEGEKQMVPVLQEFWGPFKANLEKKKEEIVKRVTEKPTDIVCDKCGKPMIEKMGRFGSFIACTGFPECKNTKPLPGSEEPVATDEKCETCGAPMMVKRGRFGPFLSCSRYPECKTVKRIDKKTGVACPECGKGDLVERRTRTRRTFYSCNRYPECKFALWSKPTGEKCPKDGKLLVLTKDGIRCSNKECDYAAPTPPANIPQ